MTKTRKEYQKLYYLKNKKRIKARTLAIREKINSDPELKEKQRLKSLAYWRSEKGKEVQRKYNSSDKAKKTRKRYLQSEKGKASVKKYRQSERGKESQRKYNQRRKDESLSTNL